MAQNQIQKLTPRHETIMNLMVAEPTLKMSDIARQLGVTPAWLSVIIHSDIFQARLREKQEGIWSRAGQSITEKLETLAHLSLDKMIDEVETCPRIDEVREIAKAALDRLGHSPGRASPGGNTYVQNNFVGVSREVLAAAREKIIAHKQQNEPVLIEADIAAAERL